MSTQKDREQTIAALSKEGVRLDVIRQLLRAGATLHRLAELECSSEAADRDRVKCPDFGKAVQQCLCRDYGSWDAARLTQPHGWVPRYMVRQQQIERRISRLCADNGLSARFSGDPRGAVLLVAVPSGATDDWGRRGIFVA